MYVTWKLIFVGFVAVCGGFATVCGAVGWLIKIIKSIRKPGKEVRDMLDNDNKRIKILEDGNRVTQMALLALMSHAINGDDIDKLTEAKTKLEQYLITK